MADARAKHLKRLGRLRRSARGWSVRAGVLLGAAAVLVPYRGLGWPDAFWAAAAGGSLTVTVWRWIDLRAFAAEPVPEPLPAADARAQARARLRAVAGQLPFGGTVLEDLDRRRAALRLRGLAAADPWRRLDRASLMLSGLAPRLTGAAGEAVAEATVAEGALRELAERAAIVERASMLGPAGDQLGSALASLIDQLETGVSAYERLVAAAAGCIASAGAPIDSLADATAFLRGVAEGLADLSTTSYSFGSR